MHCCYCLQDALQMSNKICRKYERLDDTYVVPISHTRYMVSIYPLGDAELHLL